MRAFFVQKCFAQLFSSYSLALYFFGKRKSAKKLLIKCWWNWLQDIWLAEGIRESGRYQTGKTETTPIPDLILELIVDLIQDRIKILTKVFNFSKSTLISRGVWIYGYDIFLYFNLIPFCKKKLYFILLELIP